MNSKKLKKYIFICFVLLLTGWLTYKIQRFWCEQKFFDNIDRNIISATENIDPNETRIITIPNTINADQLVICRSYLYSMEETYDKLLADGINRRTAKLIAFSPMETEGCIIHWLKNGKLLCSHYTRTSDFAKDYMISEVGRNVKFIIRLDTRHVPKNFDINTIKLKTLLIEKIDSIN